MHDACKKTAPLFFCAAPFVISLKSFRFHLISLLASSRALGSLFFMHSMYFMPF